MSDTEKRSEHYIENVADAKDSSSSKITAANDPHYVHPADARRVLRKTDQNVMPVLCAIIALQFLDKTALTYTSVMGMPWDTKLVGDQYAWLGSIFSLGLLVGQYPMCYLQQRLPLAKFTAFCIITWGVVVAATGACHNFKQLMAVRFLLGLFESSISPALMLFTAQWYRKNEQGSRTGIWASFNTLGGILGAGVAYALFKSENSSRISPLSMKAWRILFIFFGTSTIFIGIVFFFIVPDSPQTAWFLTEEEREIAARRTAENMEQIGVTDWDKNQLKEAFTDPQVLMIWAVSFLNAIPNGGITNFYAKIVIGIGISVDKGILLSMLNAWVAVITVIALVSGDKLRMRTICAALPHVISMVGGIVLWKLPASAPKARLASFYLCLAYAIASTACMSLISTNIKGRTKKTTVAAVFFIISCVGNFIGPQTFREKDAPRYAPALITIVICNSLTIAVMFALFFYYKRENARRDKIAQENPDAVTAMSALAEHEATMADMTDRKNLHFRYVM